MSARLRLAGLVFALALLLSSPVRAQEAFYQPPVYTDSTITLMESVRIALANVPSLMIQREDALSKRGIVLEAEGAFDARLVGEASFEHERKNLTRSGKKQEDDNRVELRDEAVAADSLQQQSDRKYQEFRNARETIDSMGDLDSVTFSDPFDQANWDLLVSSLRAAEIGNEPDQAADVLDVMKRWVEIQEELFLSERDGAELNRMEAEKVLRDLGLAPNAERSNTGSLNLELPKKYRTGTTVTPFLSLQASNQNFIGKPRSKNRGGQGSTDRYQAKIGFRVDIPLARGRGAESAAAAERAARINHESSVALVTHTASSTVRSAMIAYWGLVAAQSRLNVLQQSESLHVALLDISQTLVRSDEIPRAELARARARLAEARAQVEEGRRGLYESRLGFARTIGLEAVDTTQAPLAAETFPDLPDSGYATLLDDEALTSMAMENRFDYKAARLVRSATEVLARAADVDTRRTVDLQVEVSAVGSAENNVFGDGVSDAFKDATGPSGKVALSVEWPFGNNQQHGRRIQQEAALGRQSITTRDLERNIRSQVVLTTASFVEAVAQLEHFLEAARYYRESTRSETDKYRAGLSTLINTITTEQRQLDAENALISSWQRYAQLLATLRFETGMLVIEQPEGGIVTGSNLLTIPAP